MEEKVLYNYGRVCPKCGKVWNPQTLECYPCNFQRTKTVTYTNTKGGHKHG